MATIITNNQIEVNSFSNHIQKFKNMRWLLDLEYSDDVYSMDTLQKEIDKICNENFAHLIIFHHYLTEIPKEVKRTIDDIISSKDDTKKCKKLYINYVKQYRNNPAFKEYETYILMNRGMDISKEFPNFSEETLAKKFNEVQEALIEYRREELALIFNILCETPMLFRRKDFFENLPQLVYWIQTNKNKPIKELDNDDCAIIAACIGGLSYDEMLEHGNLSPHIKNYVDIHKRIQALPYKFNVQNMTQVIFRVILLKPLVWRKICIEDMVKSIKGVVNVLE